MNYPLLQKLQAKLFFTVDELAGLAGIRKESARVLAARYAEKGIFVRLKKGLYLAGQSLPHLSREDFFRLGNVLQVPSYISFMTALSFYEITTQVQQSFFESASVRRSVKYQAGSASFNFYKLKKDYYSGFVKREGFFIAVPEKAFADAVYLYSLNRYPLDFSSLDTDKLDKAALKRILKPFPKKAQEIAKRICRI